MGADPAVDGRARECCLRDHDLVPREVLLLAGHPVLVAGPGKEFAVAADGENDGWEVQAVFRTPYPFTYNERET